MRKKGFTLAEVLVSLSIIGIVAALVAPSINKIIPNKEKVMVIKAYKALHETTKMILTEPSFYLNGGSQGLADVEVPYEPDFSDNALYSGNNKYCNLLMDNMHTFSKSHATNGDGTWVTADFMSWKCTFSHVTNTAVVTVDLEEDSGNNCSYSSSCKKPDTFEFDVSKEGVITGKDELTKVYLDNMENLTDRKADYDKLSN